MHEDDWCVMKACSQPYFDWPRRVHHVIRIDTFKAHPRERIGPIRFVGFQEQEEQYLMFYLAGGDGIALSYVASSIPDL